MRGNKWFLLRWTLQIARIWNTRDKKKGIYMLNSKIKLLWAGSVVYSRCRSDRMDSYCLVLSSNLVVLWVYKQWRRRNLGIHCPKKLFVALTWSLWADLMSGWGWARFYHVLFLLIFYLPELCWIYNWRRLVLPNQALSANIPRMTAKEMILFLEPITILQIWNWSLPFWPRTSLLKLMVLIQLIPFYTEDIVTNI